ncbi:hypothetical protein SAMN02745664_1392 [Moraxella cuniculi DSM 21768]|uniref:Uncharacterized protein n=1 Tax=Moraxella cuniculi DSM 21768 TaxID=1122245 RepID=A0A1N7GAX4_9GAMM|nr:hypothetical protein [Moraxella cuniculi]OOS03008.1 hypothetical protein B0189_09800 [Moraxella cuniculi]SIS09707.1 hypothetical protein SAMN02745664_1302 [Moraxella cuniculi DSM 21768]SIS10443.1 hypothetical protein SAMN02745664_1392 [Moraxella cuniculi DSM 21768]
MTWWNLLICLIGMITGIYTFIKHLNSFNDRKTRTGDAWLVAVGTLGWSISLLDMIDSLLDNVLMHSQAETLGNVLMLIFWLGVILQVQKHCLKIKLRKRKSA